LRPNRHITDARNEHCEAVALGDQSDGVAHVFLGRGQGNRQFPSDLLIGCPASQQA
jgi:hypothetical protein